jgi:hypothetical protein
VSRDLALGVDGGYFSIQKKGLKKYSGMRYGAWLFAKNFSFRLGVNKTKDFTEFVPTILYENSYNKHSYSLEYTHQNALFYTFALCPYEKRITAHHLSLSDYISMKEDRDLWANVTMNFFSNQDREVTAQYDWRFYYKLFLQKKFSYHIALEGWYTSHSKATSCFYSPNFSDSTLIRIDPQYRFSRYFALRGKIGVGYSFKDNTDPYKFGLWIFGNTKNSFSYNAGCLYSNATRLSAGTSYNYKECKLEAGYKW